MGASAWINWKDLPACYIWTNSDNIVLLPIWLVRFFRCDKNGAIWWATTLEGTRKQYKSRVERFISFCDIGLSGAFHISLLALGMFDRRSVSTSWFGFTSFHTATWCMSLVRPSPLLYHATKGRVFPGSTRDKVVSSWLWAKRQRSARNLRSRIKAIDGRIPLARLIWWEGGNPLYAPAARPLTCRIYGCQLSTFPLLNISGELTILLSERSNATKFHRWSSPIFLPSLLFGVIRLMIHTVTKFCSLLVEEIQLVASDKSPHWKCNEWMKKPSDGTLNFRSFFSNDCTAYDNLLTLQYKNYSAKIWKVQLQSLLSPATVVFTIFQPAEN